MKEIALKWLFKHFGKKKLFMRYKQLMHLVLCVWDLSSFFANPHGEPHCRDALRLLLK